MGPLDIERNSSQKSIGGLRDEIANVFGDQNSHGSESQKVRELERLLKEERAARELADE